MGGVFSSEEETPVQRRTQQIVTVGQTYAPQDSGQQSTLVPMPMRVQDTHILVSPHYIEKDSLKLTRENSNSYSIQFKFHSETELEITVYFMAQEKVVNSDKPHIQIESSICVSQRREAGENQIFFHSGVNLSAFTNKELQTRPDAPPGSSTTPNVQRRHNSDSRYPIVIELKQVKPKLPSQGDDVCQIQHTYATIEFPTATLTPPYDVRVIILGQKHQFGNMIYDLKDIYGLQRRRSAHGHNGQLDMDMETGGRECVICLTAERDTAVLPCRHMCLCSECANIMRMQSKTCPVCRQEVTSLFKMSGIRDSIPHSS